MSTKRWATTKAVDLRPTGVPALTPKTLVRAVNRALASGSFTWDIEGWTISDETENPDALDEEAGVYAIVELVKSKEHPSGVRVARYIGQSQNIRVEAKRPRICRIVGGCEGKVRFFALYMPESENIDRREVEWALHEVFEPTISTATRPRRRK